MGRDVRLDPEEAFKFVNVEGSGPSSSNAKPATIQASETVAGLMTKH